MPACWDTSDPIRQKNGLTKSRQTLKGQRENMLCVPVMAGGNTLSRMGQRTRFTRAIAGQTAARLKFTIRCCYFAERMMLVWIARQKLIVLDASRGVQAERGVRRGGFFPMPAGKSSDSGITPYAVCTGTLNVPDNVGIRLVRKI